MSVSLELPGWVRLVASSLVGSEVVSVDWSSGRVGVVWGVGLADGRRCVIKARSELDGLVERLRAVARVQGALSVAGVPVPMVMAEPVASNGQVLTFEGLMTARGAELDADEAREASLSMLLRVVDVGERLAPAGLSALGSVSAWVDSDVAARHGALWPPPHDTSLFGPTFDGAGQDITELAAASSAALGAWWRRPERVLGHDDWEAQNLVFGRVNGRSAVVSIFDAESLALMPEPVLAGASGLQHARGLPGAPDAPTIEQVGDWIEDFAGRRGGRPTEWVRAAWAAAAWSLAYNARCDELTGVDTEDSHRASCRRDGARYRAKLAS